MVAIHPQYITDTAGAQLVVLPVDEFNRILQEIEDFEDEEDVRRYDEAKKNDDGERILFADYVKERMAKNE